MQFGNHSLIGLAANIPIPNANQVTSFSPVILPVSGRQVDLQMKVSTPAEGTALPILLLAHGGGQSNYLNSLEGYAPLADFYAGHGFAVIQPTLLDSISLGLRQSFKELPWKTRGEDLIHILDHLDDIEKQVPYLSGRLSRDNVVVVGHSFGGMTVSMLMGATNNDPRDNSTSTQKDERIRAGVILAGMGHGEQDLAPSAKEMLPFYGLQFNNMTTPALVVYGNEDVNPILTDRGANWHADPYRLSPGPKSLFTVKGGKHMLGGVSGWDALEGDDESPERLAAVQRLTWAYLWSHLYPDSGMWEKATKAFGPMPQVGVIESK